MPGHDPTACYRKSIIREFPYSEDLPAVEGIDFILRVGEQHPLERISGCLYGYRIHPDSITKSDPVRVKRLAREAFIRAYNRRGLQFDAQESKGDPPRSDNSVFRLFTVSVKEHLSRNEKRKAMRIAIDAITVSPWDFHYYLPLLHATLPKAVKGLFGIRG